MAFPARGSAGKPPSAETRKACKAERVFLCNAIRPMYKKNDPFYTSKPWKLLRIQALERDHYTCQKCLRKVALGLKIKANDATMVHHIKPRSLYPELELVLENLESLCDACHNEEHPERGFKPEKKRAPEAKRRCITIGGDRSLDKG